jgi:hypothetical protein
MVGKREGEPASKGTDEERRRQEATRLAVLRLAKEMGLDVRAVGDHPPQAESATPRAQRIARAADGPMSDAAAEGRGHFKARVGRDAQGKLEATVDLGVVIGAGLRLPLEGLKTIAGATGRSVTLAVRVGKWVHAKVTSSGSTSAGD